MKSKFLKIFTVGIGTLIFAVPLAAHHGYVAYDTNKKVTVKGMVTDWRWSNPHCILQLDVKDEGGNVVHWLFETENPNTMTRVGWARDSFKIGDQITVTLLQVKTGKPVGRIVEVVPANGPKLPGRVILADEGLSPEDSPKP